MSFWLNRQQIWPKLSKIVINLLSIPTSSAEIERSFSLHKLIIGERRRSFKIDTLSQYEFLLFNAPDEIELDIKFDDSEDES